MWEYTPTEELYHHGVKGQKWGVRKAKYKASRSAARKKYKAEQKAAKEKYKKQVGDAKTKLYKNVSRGKRVAKGVLIGIGASAATAGVVYAGRKAIEAGGTLYMLNRLTSELT